MTDQSPAHLVGYALRPDNSCLVEVYDAENQPIRSSSLDILDVDREVALTLARSHAEEIASEHGLGADAAFHDTDAEASLEAELQARRHETRP